MSVADFRARVGLHGDYPANPDAVINQGRARFTILTPRLIRLNWAPPVIMTTARPTRFLIAPAPHQHLV
ncbi:MAG: hypothetical protein HC822_01410 [Oscillochloris sp.]|nr:hypothetical protein [Oscillochloris sp.]